MAVLTVGVAQLSYHYFEQPFLRLKKRFTVVKSGEADAAEPAIPVGTEPGILGGKPL
jgi:peptidoglycan/LPS O-acetylase OafA/YrhL